MKIAVIADTHDNLPNIRKALEAASAAGVTAVVHAGDVVSPFAAKLLASTGLPVRAVFGNNDGEKAGLSKILDISGSPRILELAGRKILLCHDPAAVPPERRAEAEIFIFGHTHEFALKKTEGLLELNPGEAGGWLYGRPSFAILDLETLEAERIDI